MLITDRKRFPAPAAGESMSAEEWRVLGAAIRGGIGALQLREKDLDGRPLLERAERLREPCRKAGVRLLLNDRIDVALGAEVDGVHLPADGFPVVDARGLVGHDVLVGRSIHAVADLDACHGCDYVIFGPVFETASKQVYGPPQGLARLAEVTRVSLLPVLAVGGINASRVKQVIDYGAAGVAVIGAILDAEDPEGMARELVTALLR